MRAGVRDWYDRGNDVSGHRAADVAVLLLPGTLCDARVFGPLLERLPAMCARFVELAGADSANALARRILSEAPPSFALVGFSLGGIVALEIAALAPERVVGLALISTNPHAADPATFAARRAAVADAAERGMAAHVDQLCAGYGGAQELAPAVRDLLIDMAVSATPNSLRQQTEIAIGRADSCSRLAGFDAPTLILGGDADRVVPIAVQHDLSIANAVFATIPGAGHVALLEDAAAVAVHLGRWYARLSPISETTPTTLSCPDQRMTS